MTPADIAACLMTKFSARVTAQHLDALNPTIEVAESSLHEIALYCRDAPELAFDYLKDVEAVDWLITDEKKAKKLAVEPHLELLYQLFSFKHKHDITLKTRLPRWKGGQPGELPEVDSVSDVWEAANWHEREIYDLMGIRFRHHPNLRRILCPEDWHGHALRKDYEFPLEYHGIRWR